MLKRSILLLALEHDLNSRYFLECRQADDRPRLGMFQQELDIRLGVGHVNCLHHATKRADCEVGDQKLLNIRQLHCHNVAFAEPKTHQAAGQAIDLVF